MKNWTIALLGDGLYTWSGGVDYLASIAYILDYVDKNWPEYRINLYLVLPRELPAIQKTRKVLSKGKYDDNMFFSRIKDIFQISCKNTKIVYYRKHVKKIYDDRGKSLQKTLEEIKADICFPVLRNYYPQIHTPWIGYIPDFQEKYHPELFDQKNLKYRDQNSKRQVRNTLFFVATSDSVKKDLKKFYPGNYKVFSKPFSPVISEELLNLSGCDLKNYNLPQRYFLVSNQFWPHKSHITVFKALNLIHEHGFGDIHVICTGKMDINSEKDNYSRELLQWVKETGMDSHIHFLGYIPKKDQTEIMKRSVAVIQPSLFEGAPGGGIVVEANALFVPVIMSDIRVNMEAIGYEGITFFPLGNAEKLAECMEFELKREKRTVTQTEITARHAKNAAKLAAFYVKMIEEVISQYYPQKLK